MTEKTISLPVRQHLATLRATAFKPSDSDSLDFCNTVHKINDVIQNAALELVKAAPENANVGRLICCIDALANARAAALNALVLPNVEV